MNAYEWISALASRSYNAGATGMRPQSKTVTDVQEIVRQYVKDESRRRVMEFAGKLKAIAERVSEPGQDESHDFLAVSVQAIDALLAGEGEA